MPKRKTQQEFQNEIFQIFGDEYTVLGQYVNNRTNILIKHNKCGNDFLKIPKDMITKHSGCPYCNGNRNKKYNEEWVIKNTPKPYKYISGYTKMSEKCIFYCDECKIEFYQTPSRIINEHIYGCNCWPTKKKTQEQFLSEVNQEEYEVIDEYINSDTPIQFRHRKCNTSFKVSPYSFLHSYKQQYCPICYYKKSKGEIIIAKFLTGNDIQYNREYTFQGLPKKRFDFYLPNYNTCIEFDGKQHFEAIEYFGGKEAFLQTQKSDLEKNQFCIKNNICLYRIPYSDIDNINTILWQIFKEKSSETIEKYKIY